MGYLLPTEYVAYGLTAETTDNWVTMASALMEGYCRRPTLLAAPYTERLRVRGDSGVVRLSYLPLTAVGSASSPLISLRARLGRVQHGAMRDGFRDQLMQVFGATGSWTTMDVTLLDFDALTGELTLPTNFLGLSYNEVEVVYTAGLTELTPAVKTACAQIVRNAQATPGLNVRSSKVDTLQMQYFSGSLLDEQVTGLLRPYLAQRVG